MRKQLGWYIEIKGTQQRIDQYEVKSIFKSGTRRGLVTCGRLTPGAKRYIESIGAFYIDEVPLEMVLNYTTLGESK